ncbi:GMC oxidoreductase [Paraglaciecola aestuariivivens]
MQLDYEAIVIGSGFGGAINACRLAKKWPGKVLVLERGKRYPMGSFPRSPHAMSTNFWNLSQPDDPDIQGQRDMFGLFDIRRFEHMDAVVGAGLGGGSLIYANVFMPPPEHVFDHRWPETCKKDALEPYFQTAKSVLGARPIPDQSLAKRKIIRTELFQDFAKSDGRQSELVDINVFFGNDFDNPTDIGVQQTNRYGAIQTSCVYCAECDVGCNTHSKNTTDLNYLFVAENQYKAQIETLAIVNKITPLNEQGEADSQAKGEFGYLVTWLDLANNKVEKSAKCQRVVVSAGTLGTNELLLQCRDIHKSLPHINQYLGQYYSGNGDYLSFVIDGKKPADPNYGPVITQKIDYNLFKDFDPKQAFILEDASFPAFASWYTEGIKPGVFHFYAGWQTLKLLIKRFLAGAKTGRIGFAFKQLLKNNAAYTTAVLLCMGIDNSAGKMHLDTRGKLNVDWPYKDNQSLYNAILAIGKRFKQWAKAKVFLPMPNALWPLKSNVTVHSLGGCRLADSPEQGVTSAKLESFGQVFGYKGLYVADGSLLPSAVGANPVATISALSERVAEGITGIKPDPNGEL